MPATSGKQYRAMQAAAHGSSTLGIPKSVGQDFVSATPPEKRSEFAKHAGKLAKKRRGRK